MDPSPGATLLERFEAYTREHRWVGDALLAAALGIALGLLTLLVGVHADPPGVWVVGIIATMHAAIAWRRSAPVPSFAVVTAAHAAQVLTVSNPLPSNVLFLISLYALTVYAPRPWPGLGLVAGLIGSFVGAARFTGLSDSPPGVNALLNAGVVGGFFAASVVAAFALGSFRRVRTQYVDALEERAERAEQEREARSQRAVAEERARVAREMHDVVAHSLSVIVVQAQGGTYAARTDPAAAAGVLETIAATGRTALADMRGLLGVLRGGPAADGAGSAAPQPGLADLSALLDRTRSAGLHVSCDQLGAARSLPDTAALAVYRVVQESLTNTLKHAGADARASATLEWEDSELVVTVVDDGHGPSRGLDADGPGHGLVGMRERMAIFGGSVDAGPRPGGGFRVVARLPYAHRITARPPIEPTTGSPA